MDALDWPLATIPRIAVAGRFALADRGHPTRYRGATHALHLHDYAGQMRVDGCERALAPGDVTLSPAGLTSSYDLDVGGRHWCIHFAGEGGGERLALPLHLPAADAAGVREAVAHVAALHAQARDRRVAAVAAGLALQALLLRLGEAHVPAPSTAERAAAVIEQRFTEPLSVPAIAEAAGCSPAHLARVFRARYGTTIPHRLIARRVEHARYLLESTDLPIWRVAERAGIPDSQHFNKTVRRVLGVSPSAIRARSLGESVDPDR